MAFVLFVVCSGFFRKVFISYLCLSISSIFHPLSLAMLSKWSVHLSNGRSSLYSSGVARDLVAMLIETLYQANA